MPVFASCGVLVRLTTWISRTWHTCNSHDLYYAATNCVMIRVEVPFPSEVRLENTHSDHLPPGVFYYGRYFAAYQDNHQVFLVPAQDTQLGFSCPHCAYEHARAFCDRFGNLAALIIATTPDMDGGWRGITHDYHLPATHELTGEVLLNTQTNTFAKDGSSLSVGKCCANCGRMNHNSRTCEYPTRAYDLVGIEIEGRWRNLNAARSTANNLDMSGYSDGSVNGSNTAVAWEFQTVPGSCSKAISQLVELYPDETDYSAGMHVHVSFRNRTHFTALTTKEFFAYFRERWELWGRVNGLDSNSEFCKRLRGENSYCQVNTECANPFCQANSRYLQLNFTSFEEHSTVECRMLPMFQNAWVAVSAVSELVDIYETWLHLASPEVSFSSPVTPSLEVLTSKVFTETQTHEMRENTSLHKLEIALGAVEPKPADAWRFFRGCATPEQIFEHTILRSA